MPGNPVKTLCLALDSMEPRLLEEWCAQGLLPNLDRLFKSSVTAPVVTPRGLGNSVFWSCFFTCSNPAKNSQYYFRQIEPGSYTISPFLEDKHYLRPPFWSAFDKAGLRVAVIDLVRAPLVPDLGGIQVVDWLSHDITGVPRSWPPNAIDEIHENFGTDPFEGSADDSFNESADMAQYLDDYMRRIEAKTEMSLAYMKQGNWDLFITTYSDPHDVGHNCWHLHDPSHPWHDAKTAERVGDPVKQVYMALDAAVGRLIEAAGDDATIMFLTGPGMGPNYSANNMLEKILLHLEDPGEFKRSAKLLALQPYYRKLVPDALRKRLRNVTFSVQDHLAATERGRRRCFMIPHNDNSGAIRINLVGREPHGTVRPGEEFDKYCDELTEQLLDLVNLETGGPVVDEVVRVAEHCQGENLDYLPDLLVVWNRDAYINAVTSPRTGDIHADVHLMRSGDHTPNGIFSVASPGLEPKRINEKISPMDVGSTVTSWFGMSLPDADGSPIASPVTPVKARENLSA